MFLLMNELIIARSLGYTQTLPDINIEYLVLYQKDNPRNSVILLNYPIKNSSDFENYKVLFKDEIPKDVFKRD
jgi:hypothetical protein